MIKKIHHVAIAVRNLDESLAVFERLLGVKPLQVKVLPGPRVRAAVFPVGDGGEIELIEPMDADSGVARFLETRGQGIHHLCIEVDDVDAALKEMAGKGIELIDKQGREGLVGKIGFLNPRSAQGALIELVQCQE